MRYSAFIGFILDKKAMVLQSCRIRRSTAEGSCYNVIHLLPRKLVASRDMSLFLVPKNGNILLKKPGDK